MFGFSKKKGGIPQPMGGPRIPTERVVSLSSQGISEPEIIRSLRDEGFSPLEVDRAMKQALRSGAGMSSSAPPMPPQSQLPPPPPRMQPFPPSYGNYPPEPPRPPGMQPMGQGPGMPRYSEDKFAPTMWGDVDDDLDDDLDKLPK